LYKSFCSSQVGMYYEHGHYEQNLAWKQLILSRRKIKSRGGTTTSTI